MVPSAGMRTVSVARIGARLRAVSVRKQNAHTTAPKVVARVGTLAQTAAYSGGWTTQRLAASSWPIVTLCRPWSGTCLQARASPLCHERQYSDKPAPPSGGVGASLAAATPPPAPPKSAAEPRQSLAGDVKEEQLSRPEETEAVGDAAASANSQHRHGKSPTSSSSLPSDAESRRSVFSARFSGFMDDLQGRFVLASQALSDLTGYTAIEQIKAQNSQLESDLDAAQAELRVARREYQAVNERRATTQRELTTLLARKDGWTPSDVERFTALYRQDHELETGAQRSIERLKEAEADEVRLSAALTSGILKRYHEEQVWSDRIRRQSTWGTWGLMAVNVLLFIVLQFFAEPWRRSRLVRGIAEAETGVLDDVRKELADVRTALESVTGKSVSPTAVDARAIDKVAVQGGMPLETTPPEASRTVPSLGSLSTLPTPTLRLPFLSATWPWSWGEVKAFGSDPGRWKSWAKDLYSERTVNIRMRDVSLLALQSAAAGAAIAGGLLVALWRP